MSGENGGDERLLRMQLHPDLRTFLNEQDTFLQKRLETERKQREDWATRQERLLQQSVSQQRRVEEHMHSFRDLASQQQSNVNEVLEAVREMIEGKAAPDDPAVADAGGDDGNDRDAKLGLPIGAGLNVGVGGDPVSPPASPGASPLAATSPSGVWPSNTSKPSSASEQDVTPWYWRDASTRTALGRFATHPAFEGCCGAVIAFNAVFIGYSSQYAMDHKFDEDTKNDLIRACELFFFAFYLAELLLKLSVFRLTFFTHVDRFWNYFDSVLVLFAGYDVVIELAFGGEVPGANLTWMRLLRLLKLMKMLRVVRVMRFFRELRLMLAAAVVSLRSLFWAMLMLGLIMYIFGLCFLQATTAYLTDLEPDQIDEATQEGIESHWGSVGAAMLSLYMAITHGHDWAPLAEPLKKAGIVYYVMFLFYIAFLNFAVLNVLTGIFVDQAMQIAALDRDMVVQEEMDQSDSYMTEIRDLFHKMDKHGTGSITWKALKIHVDDPEVRSYFDSLDLEVSEVKSLCKMLERGRGQEISIEDFVGGCTKLKGGAKSLDMITLMYDTKKYMTQLGLFMAYCEEIFAEMHRYFERLGARKSTVEPLADRLARNRCPVQLVGTGGA